MGQVAHVAPTEERYLERMRAIVKQEDWDAIVETALAFAKAGDKDARNFVAYYLIGKPTEYVNLDATSNGNTLAALVADLRSTLPDETDMET